MFSRAWSYISHEVEGLQRAVFVLAGAALLSSLLALLRDRLLASTFGAGDTLDIYYAAFRLPDLIFVGTGALVSVYVLIPELAKRTLERQREYIDSLVVTFSVFAICISLVASIFAPYILHMLFPQFAGTPFAYLVLLTRMILIQPILLGISNIYASITQSQGRYLLYSLSPLLYNVGIIIGIIVLYPIMGLVGLAIGVQIGALLHVLVQMPPIVRDGFVMLRSKISLRELLATSSISVPRALTLSMSQIAFLILIAMAGTLAQGSISVFTLGFNLSAVPLAIIGASYSVAAFPTLASALSKGNLSRFVDHVSTAVRYTIFWSLPIAGIILVLRAHIVRIIFGAGNFDWTDTRLTAAVFAIICISLVTQGIALILTRAYYAAEETLMPFVVSAIVSIVTVVSAFGLLRIAQYEYVVRYTQDILRLRDVAGSGVVALAVAYVAGSVLGCVILVWQFKKKFNWSLRPIARTLAEGLVSAIGAIGVAYGVLYLLGDIATGSTTLSVFLKCLAGGSAGIVASSLIYAILGNREWCEVSDVLAKQVTNTAKKYIPMLTSSAEESERTL